MAKKVLKVVVFVVLVVFSGMSIYAGGEKSPEKVSSGKPYEGVTLHLLMEDVPDTTSIEKVLPEFEAKTGIKVVFEKVVYTVMHDKLVPQLMTGEGNGSYDVLEVDNYWVGEFVIANWLRGLDDYMKKTPEINLNNYIDCFVKKMISVGDKHYFIPMWTYPMGIVYRTDIINDPKFQAFYEKKTGKSWEFPPKDLFEYAEMAKAAGEYTPKGIYGVAMQGAKVDPLVMEITNYLFALGGDYYDRNTWKATFDSPEGKNALLIYKDLLEHASQPGASGANFDDAFNVFGQGKAVFAITYNFLMSWLLDKNNSVVYDKVDFIPIPGGGLLGGWSWAIPVSSPHPDAGWEFIKWVESKKIQKIRAMNGGMPTAKWLYDDPEFLEKYKYQKRAKEIFNTAKPVPIISQSTRMVEIIGENSSSAIVGDISIEEALKRANKELNEIVVDDPLVEMQKK